MGGAGSKRRRLSPGETALWRLALRDTTPLPGHEPPPAPEPGAIPRPAAKTAPPPDPAAPPAAPQPRPLRRPLRVAPRMETPGLDRRTAERLRQGELAIDARLDLHGMTQHAAYEALRDFLDRAWDRQWRVVLVITGKGGERREGVLRASLPAWLDLAPHRARVLALAEAHGRHGGAGAFYLLMRRQRA